MTLFIDAATIDALVKPKQLVARLANAFCENIITPQRQHYDIANHENKRENTLLMMPSWQLGKYIGVKLVTVCPENSQYNLPSIQGVYVLFDATNGKVVAQFDAPCLTAKRTAAASALASNILSRKNSKVLLMIGTGTLAPELIKAHCAVRQIEKVLIWGRNTEKAEALCQSLTNDHIRVIPVDSIEQGMQQADIISCATLAKTPIVFGKWLKPGQHLDLVGAYRPDMREADDQCLLRSNIFVDSFQGALHETGDLKIPLEKGVIQQQAIKADLFQLCGKQYQFERTEQDITMFKSVGHALEDLAAAQYLFQQWQQEAK